MTEKAVLKPMKRDVYLTGKVKLGDNSFKIDQKSASGFTYSNANLGIETGDGNVIYVEMMGGFAQKPMAIKAQNKEGNDLEINWSDRLNEKIVEQVADYRLLKTNFETPKSFLSAYDMIPYLKANLTSGMEVTVRATRKMSVYKGEPQSKYELVSIGLPYERKGEDGEVLPTEYRATFAQTILIDEDSVNVTMEDEEKGETIVNAFAVDYIGKYDGAEIKKNALFPITINVPVDTETAKAILERLFKVESGVVREMTIEGQVLEGYEKASADTELVIPQELQDLIDMGLWTLEDVKKRMTVRGNKVSKLLFTKPSIHKDDEGQVKLSINDEKYTQSDLYYFEQAINGEEQEETETESNSDTTGKSEGDEWLNLLGV